MPTESRPMSDPSDAQRPERREWSERQTTHSPVLAPRDARQGVVGHNVRYVLGFSIATLVVVFLAIWLFYFA